MAFSGRTREWSVCPLSERFDVIFGTSTGAIIAPLLALGSSGVEIHQLYREYVPERRAPAGNNAAAGPCTFGVSRHSPTNRRRRERQFIGEALPPIARPLAQDLHPVFIELERSSTSEKPPSSIFRRMRATAFPHSRASNSARTYLRGRG